MLSSFESCSSPLTSCISAEKKKEITNILKGLFLLVKEGRFFLFEDFEGKQSWAHASNSKDGNDDSA
jgi:hypothetical protein